MQIEKKENFINSFLDNTGSLTDILYLEQPKNNIIFDI